MDFHGPFRLGLRKDNSADPQFLSSPSGMEWPLKLVSWANPRRISAGHHNTILIKGNILQHFVMKREDVI